MRCHHSTMEITSVMRLFLVIIAAIHCGYSPVLSAADYYLSPGGSDANNGLSQASAWKTIQKVNALQLRAGDRVLFEGGKEITIDVASGLALQDSGTASQPITVASYGTGRATLKVKSPALHGIVVSACQYLTIRDLIITGPGIANQSSGGNGLNLTWFNNSIVRNVEVSNFRGNGVYLNGSHDSLIEGVYAYGNGFCGIYSVGESVTSVNNCSNLTIRDCRTNDNPGDPLETAMHSGNGILLTSTADSLIEYCEAARNGANMGSTTGGPVGIWVASSTRVTIQHCVSHDNKSPIVYDGGGFDLDQGTTDCIVQYNYSYGNHGAGYLVYTNPGTFNSGHTIRYNISEDDAWGSGAGAAAISISGQSSSSNTGMKVYNNTVINLIGKNAIGGNSNFSNSTNSIRNNIMIIGGGGKFTNGLGTAVFQGNLYWNVNGSGNWAGYATLADWRLNTGNETLGGSPTGFYSDPRMTMPGKDVRVTDPRKIPFINYYRLASNSPAIDAGLDLKTRFSMGPGPTDFFGTSLSTITKFDIGMHEATLAVLPTDHNSVPVISSTSATNPQLSLP